MKKTAHTWLRVDRVESHHLDDHASEEDNEAQKSTTPSERYQRSLGCQNQQLGKFSKSRCKKGKLENGNRAGRPRSTSLVDDRKIICMVMKNTFMTAQRVKNALQDVGVYVSLSQIKRRLVDHNLSGFTRCKPPSKRQKQKAETWHFNVVSIILFQIECAEENKKCNCPNTYGLTVYAFFAQF